MTLVLVTGSRWWTNRRAVSDMLINAQGDTLAAEMALLHGACPIRRHPETRRPASADMLADEVARRLGWADIRRRPASWRELGARAGMARNAAMVVEARNALICGADVACIAFCMPCTDVRCRRPRPHVSHGTENCMTLARGAGIRVVRVWEGAAPSVAA